MATLDFTPLVRSSIGFDQLPALLAHALERPETTYPPYNIEKVGEDQYRIVMAVAGFGRDDIALMQEQNRLTIRGKRKGSEGKTYLHRGIANRAFEHHFDLADYVEVIDATMGEGLLLISLKREIPEALKPRRIPINDQWQQDDRAAVRHPSGLLDRGLTKGNDLSTSVCDAGDDNAINACPSNPIA